MKSLKKQLKKSKVKLSDLGLYLKLVYLEYPEVEAPQELAEKVSAEFNVVCTKKDVLGYLDLHVQYEDYELESRRQQYGIIM